MKKILLADDEKDIVEFLQYNLRQEGFEVIAAYDGLETLEKVKENPDLILLDIMMPKMDGYEVCKKIRATKGFEHTPIIFLTAKAGEVNEIKGLELGASDYVQKPISPRKLIARVKANLRSSGKDEGKKSPPRIAIGPLMIDKEKYEVSIDGKIKIFPRRVFGREILLKDVWGPEVYVVDRTVDVHIRKIREKLGDYSDLIETVKGVGYRFKSVE
jgi:two-component system alkaline phosphatase synthesis response regulator PhoP